MVIRAIRGHLGHSWSFVVIWVTRAICDHSGCLAALFAVLFAVSRGAFRGVFSKCLALLFAALFAMSRGALFAVFCGVSRRFVLRCLVGRFSRCFAVSQIHLGNASH